MVDESSRTACSPHFPARLGTWTAVLCCGLLACTEQSPNEDDTPLRYARTGEVQARALDEISGIAVSARHPGLMWVHNDDGRAELFALDDRGTPLGRLLLEGAGNRDWEDLALVPGVAHDWLVVADTGDNFAQWDSVFLYVVAEPTDLGGTPFDRSTAVHNRLEIRWPDGPRDCESIAWDPDGNQLLLISKRDRPPRLYALDLETLMGATQATPDFLGEVRSLRPPDMADRRVFGHRAQYVSQPTGLDVSRDGRRLAMITYRSLYLFELAPGQNRSASLNATPVEILGPRGGSDEAVGFTPDGQALYVIPEGEQAPVFRFEFTDPAAESPP